MSRNAGTVYPGDVVAMTLVDSHKQHYNTITIIELTKTLIIPYNCITCYVNNELRVDLSEEDLISGVGSRVRGNPWDYGDN